MKVRRLEPPGVILFEPRVFSDARGRFLETWHEARYREAGLDLKFCQDNVSCSGRGVIRGLHLQYPRAQAKLVSVLRGEIYDVAVDVRVGSPTFGQWVGMTLSDKNARQLYMPVGFAHGFAVLSDEAVVSYKCTDHYDPGTERVIRWDDSDLAIPWPVERPVVSEKDATAPRLADIPRDHLPKS